MSAPLSVRLESESGQTLIFVVVSLLVLVLFLGLVIDIGSWKRGQRQAQAAADAAALAAVQRLPNQTDAIADANDYAERNWAGVDVEIPPAELTDSTVTVLTSRPMPGFVAGIIPVTVRADATARVGVPAETANLAPIALQCDLTHACDPWELGESVDPPFRFDELNQESPNSTFGPIALPGVDVVNFDRFLRCDALAPSSFDCNPDVAKLETRPKFDRTADELRIALRAAGPGTRLVPIYDSYNLGDGGFHVVGWAAFSISQDDLDNLGEGEILNLGGTFEPLLTAGTGRNSFPPTELELNFGVRAVGLVD